VRRITVRVERIPIPQELLGGDYEDDPVFRERFQTWVRELWERKDTALGRLLAESAGA
jgi:hypothetical protein